MIRQIDPAIRQILDDCEQVLVDPYATDEDRQAAIAKLEAIEAAR